MMKLHTRNSSVLSVHPHHYHWFDLAGKKDGVNSKMRWLLGSRRSRDHLPLLETLSLFGSGYYGIYCSNHRVTRSTMGYLPLDCCGSCCYLPLETVEHSLIRNDLINNIQGSAPGGFDRSASYLGIFMVGALSCNDDQ